ncbi:uncharacterized protein BP01DRAFT_360981 [Aspergillus saccharolyticus JOP 1030-1]|uniref:Uncharacterized protein n=1 Tax=Aspergillus saccharolyticus JOP 1030-1 TaxID=1450539 RepID=A0A318Z373_9EURO|nr:hypothetical protein BP01DRAFT_360981 [Aspergillus saccharolyticus JOP 1030-1]PYH40747.1 hypothetical protein BP01DRAFT_360981 [Aspergillus saccharolyticus JOP 1030-1]
MSLTGSRRSIGRRCQLSLHARISSPAGLLYSSLHSCLIQNNLVLHHQLAPRPSLTSLFHTTASSNALYRTPRRSPTVRRAENNRIPVAPVPNANSAYESHIEGDPATHLAWLQGHGVDSWADARIAKSLKSNITKDVFVTTGKHLITRAHGGPPTLGAFENNPCNLTPFEVFNIGRLVLPHHQSFQRWLCSAGALAQVRPAIYIQAAAYLKNLLAYSKSKYPPRDEPYLQAVEALATGPQPDPRAMCLHAQVLCHRQHYRQAIALLDEVLELIYPSKELEHGFETPLYFPPIESVWDTYLWVQGIMHEYKSKTKYTRDEIIRRAATEFKDPKYLVLYAGILREQGRWDEYEECMFWASRAGNPQAIRRLASYYYFTALGRYRRRGESPQDFRPVKSGEEGRRLQKEQNRSWWQRLSEEIWSGHSLPSLTHYRALAREWFELATFYGSPESAVIVAVMDREDGRPGDGANVLRELLREGRFQGPEREKLQKSIESLLDNWSDPAFKPKVPESYYVL